ncbi:RhtX/FptX family siderophore transporter [Cupriavidus agavae]|nr:RhtX/FptX family siderophore transporter [Cupriavidus agavae]
MAPPPTPHLWLLIACLYVSQGVPFGVAMEALPAILRREGASLASLALLPLVGLPWVVKFLWASLVDNHHMVALGRRRSWIVPMQAIVLACLMVAALLGVREAGVPVLLALMVAASLASATQDIATDGLTAERFGPAQLSRANALQVGGTMVGFFAGGAGCLMLSGWLGTRGAIAALTLPAAASLALAMAWPEPRLPVPQVARAGRASLAGFVRRRGSVALMAAALLSALAAVSGYGLSRLLLVDGGWPLDQVGRLGMAGGLVTVLVGCGGGAWLVQQIGARRVFCLGLACAAGAAAIWLLLARQLHDLPLAGVIAATLLGSFGAGSASVAVMTLAMRFARAGTQTATDVTVIQSTRDTGEMLGGASLTALAGAVGFAGSFGIGLAIAGVALLGARYLAPGTRESPL